MGLQTRDVNFEGKGIVAKIVVSEAAIKHSIRKGVLALRAESEELDPTLAAMGEFTYMNCLSVAEGTITYLEDAPKAFWPEGYDETNPEPIEVPVGKLDVDTFLSLPSGLGSRWVEAVYELNPSWRAGARTPDEDLGEAIGGGEKTSE